MEVIPDNLPEALRHIDRWVGWRWTWQETGETGYWNKPPVHALGSGLASCNDSATWCKFDEAFSAYVQSGNLDGLGIMLGPVGGGLNLVGVDFDDCRDPATGEIDAQVLSFIRDLQCYAEVSPSGEGVKCLMLGSIPDGRSKFRLGADMSAEFYQERRYFTVTGMLAPFSANVLADRTSELAALYEQFAGQQSSPVLTEVDTSQPTVNGFIDSAVCSMLRTTRQMQDAGDGSKRLFTVACRAVEFNLSDEDAIRAIRAYAAQRPFPRNYSDADILTRLRDAEDRNDVLRGSKSSPPRSLTDMGNAQRLCDRHGHRIRYIHPWKKWLVWNGIRWKLDDTGEIMRLAKQTVNQITIEAEQCREKESAAASAKHADASKHRARLKAMIELAQSDEPIPITHEQLDTDPLLLNCENGTLDLKTGRLRPHDPADLITMTTGVYYPTTPQEHAPLWEEFLSTIFNGNDDVIRYLQRCLGAALVGEQTEHLLLVLHGKGANGKSVFTNAIQHALGGYAMTAPFGHLMTRKFEQHPTEMADLYRKRLVIINETRDGQKLDEGLVKALTGGDTIRARRMREDHWQFEPSHLPVLVTNHKPAIDGTDLGIWRRVRLVPFDVVIPPERQDKRLLHKLRQEAPGILQWLVEGCREWQQYGLLEPTEVLAATNEYRVEADILQRWLDDCCVLNKCNRTVRTKASELLASFNAKATSEREQERSATWLGRQLSEKGFKRARKNSGIYWEGISLK